MAQVATTPTTVPGLFKKVYASVQEILPSGYPFQARVAKFETAKKVGESLSYSIPLTHENGFSLFGSSGDIQTFNDAQAAVMREALIKPTEIFVSSALSTAALSRAAEQGERAFKQASKDRVVRNVNSHHRLIEHLCYYGQDTYGLGRVAYFTGTWKGVAFTNGSATLAGTAFTTGVNIAAKKILINPADLASGIWLGSEGMEVRQRIIGGAVAASGAATGKVVSTDLKNGIITVDFDPVVATGAASHCLELLNQNGASGGDFMGAKAILATSGSLFGISNTTYSLWKGGEETITGKMTFSKMVDALMSACNRGLDRDVEVHVSYDSWADMMTEQAALRHYDSSYKPSKAENGMEGIQFRSLNGMVDIVPTRFVRRADAFVFAVEDWKRIGSTDITMKIPGVDDGELIVKPITTNAFVFRSYSDTALLCLAPAQSEYLSGIDPDAVS